MELTDLKLSEIKEVCKIMGATPREADRLLESGDWVLLDDTEADEKLTELIEESIWAFNPTFLSSITGIDSGVFEAVQNNGRCESNNEALLKIVEATCGIDYLVNEAVMWDGRGHFISSYDGHEYEVGDYFLYRFN